MKPARSTRRFGLLFCLGVGAIAVSACAPLPQQNTSAPMAFSAEETVEPVQVFSDACLATLPRFGGFERAVTQDGLSLATEDNGNRIFSSDSTKRLLAIDGELNGKSACGVSFLGSGDARAVGQQFLVAAQQRTGGPARESFSSEYFAYAVHLQNNSVLTHEARRSGRQTRHVFLITPPVPRDAVAGYLSN